MSANVRILIIEDHPGIQFSLDLALGLEGHESIPVDRGEDALEAIKTSPVDLILLDLNTNGMTAYDFMKELVAHCESQSIAKPPVGILSGSFVIDLEARRIGADFFVRKPFDHDDLIRKINEYQKPGLAVASAGENPFATSSAS